jgi:hypothetical protein
MKSYNVTQFRKDNLLFRWQHPDIRQTYWTKDESYWDPESHSEQIATFNLTTIWYKDDRILQFYTNDESNRNKKGWTYQTHKDNAKVHGLITNNSYNSNADAMIDGLYYKANPPKYYNNDGTLKKGFWGMLTRRMRSSSLIVSWVTQHMFDEAIKILKHEAVTNVEISQSNNDLIEGYINEVLSDDHNIPSNHWYRDPLTNKYHVSGNGRSINLGTYGRVRVHALTLPEDYGYRYDDRHSVYLLPDEFYHNYRVYNRNEVNIINCSECNRETIDTECVDGVCTECVNAAYKIHNYSTRVEGMLKFKAKKVMPNTIYLGCELEYETINRNKAQVDVGKLLKGHALMKSDGSIRNGFEIVTCPATLDIHLDVFKNFYDNIPPDLKIEKNVGMHVHISRKPLSQLTLGKMAEFLNRLDNKDFIHHIAGRIDNNYAKQDHSRNVTYPWKNQRSGGDRYNALNLQNQNTVEIRLFATPMDYKTFAMRLQFCQALVDYCQPAQSKEPLKQQTHYGSFLNWVRLERYSYPELHSHLKGFN